MLYLKKEPPKCCIICKYLYHEWVEGGYIGDYYCELGIFLPIKKNSCKKQIIMNVFKK